jgi:hypothetical protein
MRQTLRLVAVPVLISAAVTALRLTGELLGWNERWFSRATGGVLPSGWSWVVGITWLPAVFGAYFAYKLRRSGDHAAHPGRALGLACAGAVFAFIGLRFVVPVLPLPFPPRLLAVWALMVAAAAVQGVGWPSLFRALFLYGLGSRAVVAAVMFFAMLGSWGTHYDYADVPRFLSMPFWPRFLWLGFFPQMVFWVADTIVLGAIAGSAVALGMRLWADRKRAAA